jgi:hypothetical protein
MFDEHDLVALLQAYIAGDVLARKALLDAMDEAGDPRTDAVRNEDVNWDALAGRLAAFHFRDQAYMRWVIDCARLGSPTTEEVAEAVRNARRKWLQKLFPELAL